MKKSLLAMALMLSTFSAFSAETISLENTKKEVNVARVVEIVKLVNKSDIQVNLVVVDNGGSTDVAPTQSLFFNIYAKGELFNTDASYDLGSIYSLQEAKRISGGVYEIKISGVNNETTMPEDQILRIDAQKSIISIKGIRCENRDCEASVNFKEKIQVSTEVQE